MSWSQKLDAWIEVLGSNWLIEEYPKKADNPRPEPQPLYSVSQQIKINSKEMLK